MKKAQQIANGKLTTEEIQHLRRQGVSISNKNKSLRKRPLRRAEFLSKKTTLLDIINLLASITIIISLITWWSGRQERWENEIFSTWHVINEASEDKSGVVRIALERLLRNDFSLAGLELQNANLSEANLQNADLSLAKLENTDLSLANLQDADLIQANLQDADLIQANLQNANLSEANLQNIDLSLANLQNTNLLGANLQNADLGEANLQNADLSLANLQDAELSVAKLQNTNLWAAKFQDADLMQANLQDADLMQANLQNADLFDARLENTNFSGANLQNAFLQETKYLKPEQIKLACFWDKAIYIGEWNRGNYVAIEPDNTNYIEELKQDTASDPVKPPYC